MRSSDSSEPSATSGSDTSDDEKSHPLDSYLAQRQAANAKDENNKNKRPPPPPLHLATSSEESGELPPESIDNTETEDEDDFDDELANESDQATSSSSSSSEEEEDEDSYQRSSSSSSGEDSDDEKSEPPPTTAGKITKLSKLETQKQQQQIYTPVGVTILEEGQTAERNAEMTRLLRLRRYFDEDFEENAKRCFKCGAAGHMARDCTNPPRLRSCYLCAEFGHDGRDCPNQLCWKCLKSGHQSRDCPFLAHHNEKMNKNNSKKRVRAWDEEDNPTVCLKCGRPECPCAGYGDYARAEGGCTNSYKPKDLEKVRCYMCGQKGHLACMNGNSADGVVLQLPPIKISCYNCGEGGHSAENCRKEKPVSMRAERQRDNTNSSTPRYDRYDNYEYRQEPRHHQQQHQRRDSYGERKSGARGGGSGGGFRRGGGEYSQERQGRYSDYNADSRKRRRYEDDYGEDRSYAAAHYGGSRDGNGSSYKWNVHANAYGALDDTEYDGGFYETPPQQYGGQRKKPREKTRFSGGGGGRGGGSSGGHHHPGKRFSGGGGGNMSNKRR
jgi:hypothetical protein